MDSGFVENERYAQVLVSEVPVNRRSDVLVALYKNRASFDVRKLRYLIKQLLSLLDEAQLEQYLATVSRQLRTANEESEIRTSLQMLRPDLWPRVHEAARLRIENKLIQDLNVGKIKWGGKTTGALATWAGSYLKNFELRKQVDIALITKLGNTDPEDRHYAAKYFLPYFPEIFISEGRISTAVHLIATQIRAGDQNVREALISTIRQYPNEWQSQLAEMLNDLADPTNPAVYLSDGTAFLDAPITNEEDDIPF